MSVRLEHVIARNMAELRAERDWTQADLAQRMCEKGVAWTPNRVTQLETLRRPVSLIELISLAGVFLVPPARLLAGDDAVAVAPDVEVPLSAIRATWTGEEAACSWTIERPRADRAFGEQLRKIANRIGVAPGAVEQAAQDLYARPFLAERDGRVGGMSDVRDRSARTRLGHTTRAMIREVAKHLNEQH